MKLLELARVEHHLCIVASIMRLTIFVAEASVIGLPAVLEAEVLCGRALTVQVSIIAWARRQLDLFLVAFYVIAHAALLKSSKFGLVFVNLESLRIRLSQGLFYFWTKILKIWIKTYLRRMSCVAWL